MKGTLKNKLSGNETGKNFLVVVVVAKQHIVSKVHITTQQIETTLDGPGPSAHIKMGDTHDFGKVM